MGGRITVWVNGMLRSEYEDTSQVGPTPIRLSLWGPAGTTLGLRNIMIKELSSSPN